VLREKDKPMAAKALIGCSLLAVVLAGIGAFGTDIYLASTQWVLIAILLSCWGIYLMVEAVFHRR
jgi:hypothetical protein